MKIYENGLYFYSIFVCRQLGLDGHKSVLILCVEWLQYDPLYNTKRGKTVPAAYV